MKTRKLSPLDELHSLIEFQENKQFEDKLNLLEEVEHIKASLKPINIIKNVVSDIRPFISSNAAGLTQSNGLLPQIISILGNQIVGKNIALEVFRKFVLPAVNVNLKTNTSSSVLFAKSVISLIQKKSQNL